MLANRLIQLIETHAKSLTSDTMQDILTNETTRSFRKLPKHELEPRIASIYQNLGKWIGNPNEDSIRQEYEDWGRTRFRQGIPFSEIVFVLMLTKKHLRKFIRDHGQVAFSGDRVTPGEFMPVELYAIQELNYQVGEFFDRALYHLVRGYEAAAATRFSAV
ncbi:MAG TPA: RsbRD N-terminal domain-containing protein [Candidatus Eisenbacteria bacterium]|nr:RsbRD N-terminal domain-containing protein [Candidatus Eisenbacteria bacterium]